MFDTHLKIGEYAICHIGTEFGAIKHIYILVQRKKGYKKELPVMEILESERENINGTLCFIPDSQIISIYKEKEKAYEDYARAIRNVNELREYNGIDKDKISLLNAFTTYSENLLRLYKK